MVNTLSGTEEAVTGVLDRFAEAYAAKDLQGLLALFSPEPGMVAIGTGEDEWCQGREELAGVLSRDFLCFEQIAMEFKNLSVSERGSLSWVSGRMMTSAQAGRSQVSVKDRMTAVLEKREGRWLFVQLHISRAAGEQGG